MLRVLPMASSPRAAPARPISTAASNIDLPIFVMCAAGTTESPLNAQGSPPHLSAMWRAAARMLGHAGLRFNILIRA